jgi:putative heme-binding domain-containing protein
MSCRNVPSPNLQRMLWYALEPQVASDPVRALLIVESVSPQLRKWIARRTTEVSLPATVTLAEKIDQIKEPRVLTDLLNGFNEALISVKLDQFPTPTVATMTRLVDHPDDRVRQAAITAAATIGDTETLSKIRILLHDVDAEMSLRQAALAGLAQRKPPKFATDLRQLLTVDGLLEPALRAAASVSDLDLSLAILNQLSTYSKRSKEAAIDALIARPSSAKVLVEALEQNKIPPTDVSVEQARQIVALKDKELLRRFEQVWGSARPSSADRLQTIKAWQRDLDPSRISKADLTNGRLVYQKNCGNCHKLFGEGNTIGPDLTGSNRQNLSYILTNVIDPSATVPADFRLTNVLTVDGRIVSGIVSQRSKASITLQTPTESINIKSEDIENVQASPLSMMPDGLLDKLPRDDVRDLFAWIMK